MENPSKTARIDIPNQLILEEILPKIPTKSLCRFKSVSREWDSVIKSVKFASRSVLTVSLSEDISLESVEFYGDVIIDFNTFDDSIKPPSFLISSCNGLALIVSTYDKSDDVQDELPDNLHLHDFGYVVCNPIVGVDHFIEIQHLKEYLLADGDWGNRNYNFGFGYVSSKDDYYIVAIDSQHDSEVGVYTYSLRSQQWNIQTVRLRREEAALTLNFQDPWYCQSGTLANEALHWGMLEGNDNRFIFAYDLVTLEEWRLIDLPYRDFGDLVLRLRAFSVCCLDDCLCAWANYDNNVIEIWMMKEYGVMESWTKLVRLQMDDYFCCRKIFGFTKPNMVLLFSDYNELIPVDFSCDPPKLSKAILENVWEGVSYVPSHVSVFALSQSQENR